MSSKNNHTKLQRPNIPQLHSFSYPEEFRLAGYRHRTIAQCILVRVPPLRRLWCTQMHSMTSGSLYPWRNIFFPTEMISTSLELPITIGTYARIVKPASIEGDLNLFTWTCIMHVTGQPFGDAGEFIERVEFTLHKSFPNVCELYGTL